MSVVQQVDETLKKELLSGPLRAANVQVSFETPDSDWAARRSGPCVNVFLYGIEEDSSRSQSGGGSVIDEEGTVVGRSRPPRFFRLAYLVSVWAQSVQDEHRMLGVLLEWCVCTGELISTGTADGGKRRLSLGLRETAVGAESASSRLWPGLGTAPRPVVDLLVTVPISEPTEEAGPAPGKGMALRARQLLVSQAHDQPLERAGPARPRRNVEEIV
ncbi:DUF4255 domain-containing protein [Streptomyces sp. H27-D2]|uniref:DUF4255 domain-containing protein n=1 Tax=Streptomyces sp. H27-D2 TaxID=3046304 RepID=UPI002DBD67AA|nr:DUF4255 domain-containing protein [Streptomyces sp. H27-D2]MEC4017983.1 DUF4255 domain-containing protein [Streptomyces sp. H27-D2]